MNVHTSDVHNMRLFIRFHVRNKIEFIFIIIYTYSYTYKQTIKYNAAVKQDRERKDTCDTIPNPTAKLFKLPIRRNGSKQANMQRKQADGWAGGRRRQLRVAGCGTAGTQQLRDADQTSASTSPSTAHNAHVLASIARQKHANPSLAPPFSNRTLQEPRQAKALQRRPTRPRGRVLSQSRQETRQRAEHYSDPGLIGVRHMVGHQRNLLLQHSENLAPSFVASASFDVRLYDSVHLFLDSGVWIAARNLSNLF